MPRLSTNIAVDRRNDRNGRRKGQSPTQTAGESHNQRLRCATVTSMRLYAVVAPPADEADRLLRGVAAHADPYLTWEPSTAIHVGLAFFGNMVLSDVNRLSNRLAAEVARTDPISLRFAGGSALESEGDDSVWVTVHGDTDELRALAISIAAVARSDGFTVDRRWYQPHARVARIHAATTVPSLQGTLDRLQSYEGLSWSVTEVTLIEAKATSDPSELGAKSVLGTLPLRA
jgi:2'-5' RNA ligase